MRVQIRYTEAMAGEIELPEFARRVRDLLETKEWSAAELARRSGLHPGTVSNILKGKHPNPTRKMAVTVAAAFGVSVEDLYSGAHPSQAVDEMALLLGHLSGRRAAWAREVIQLAGNLTPNQQRILLDTMRDMATRSQPAEAGQQAPGDMEPPERDRAAQLRMVSEDTPSYNPRMPDAPDPAQDPPNRATG